MSGRFVGADDLEKFKCLVLNKKKKSAQWQTSRERWTWDRLFNQDDEASKATGTGIDKAEMEDRIYDLFHDVRDKVERFQNFDPLPMKQYQLISPAARSILIKRGRLRIVKGFDPEALEELQRKQMNMTVEQRAKEKLAEISKSRQPVLKLPAQGGGRDILYSDNSLKKLAFNDTSQYFDGVERDTMA